MTRHLRPAREIAPFTLDDIRAWPPTVDVPTAAKAFGVSRSYAFELVRTESFPCRVIRVGSRWRVPTSAILASLEGDGDRATA